ncbi:MAG: putative Holliday junction resolvase [Lentisphaeria bacterium]|jgi:putative Holliday junction resolvase
MPKPSPQLKASLTVVAFDFGTKSIGVALAMIVRGDMHDENTSAPTASFLPQVSSELNPIKAIEGIPDWDIVESLLQQWSADRVLVGLPFKSDGSDMEITRRARKFGNRLNARFGLPLSFVDERLSTHHAKEEAFQRGHNGNFKQRPIDSIAARLILESWLSEQNFAHLHNPS